MKVLLYMAMSADGMIATEDNGEDFLSHQNWLTFVELAHDAGCMIWGRKTHDIVRGWDKEYLLELSDVMKVIVSKDASFSIEEGYHLARSPKEALEILKKGDFETVILTGGSKVNASFAKEGLIDEVLLNIEPTLVGRGIPLFSDQSLDMHLRLLSSKDLGGIVQLHYEVEK